MLAAIALPAGATGAASEPRYIVEVADLDVNSKHYAARGDVVGPFASLDSALDWRDEFFPLENPFLVPTEAGPAFDHDPILLFETDGGWFRRWSLQAI